MDCATACLNGHTGARSNSMTTPWLQDASSLADAVRRGETDARDVLEASIEAIETSDLNAVFFVDAAGARHAAETIDARVRAGEEPGPFAGVPMVIKDVHDVAGMPTTHGSLVYKDHVAAEDCTQVARLRAAGAVIVGKSTMSEFGLVSYTSTKAHGTTRNPWNLERTPAGSSGGSAAAVAGGLVPIASGGDGGGSIRIPAAYTGLVGMKGTFGRIPRGRRAANGALTVQSGPLARSVRDVARYYDVTAGYDSRDPFSLPTIEGWERDLGTRTLRDLRVALSPGLGVTMLEPDVDRLVMEAGEELIDVTGMNRVEVTAALPDKTERWANAGAPSLFNDLKAFWPDCRDDLTYEIAIAMGWLVDNYRIWHPASVDRYRMELNEAFADIFERTDILLCATNPHEPFVAEGPLPAYVGEVRVGRGHNGSLTIPGNITGYPAISVPAGLTSAGLPVGLQAYARRHEDALLLDLALAWERQRPWPLVAPGAPV
jgi:aspartyl-tRNA(Asn)/glutamyl-tRNA(Gln) amidotransferase subunit A